MSYVDPRSPHKLIVWKLTSNHACMLGYRKIDNMTFSARREFEFEDESNNIE